MIKSFRDKETKRLFNRERHRKLPASLQRTAKKKLNYIDAAISLGSLNVPPGNRLEALKGSRAGQQSIRINNQWRICFTWKSGNAFDVEICDYR